MMKRFSMVSTMCLVGLVSLVCLTGLTVLTGCSGGKQAELQPEPPPEPVRAQPPTTPPPAPERTEIQEDTFQGNQIEEPPITRRDIQDQLKTVYFDFDKSDLRSAGEEALAKNAAWLKEHSEFLVRIEGHCDERGTNEYNLALGDRRANAARDYLTGDGVEGSRLTTITYGEDRPVCVESDEACWQKNRRAYMVITGRR